MKTEPYDSTEDTNAHILRVRELLYIVQNKLEDRGWKHDQSKLGQVEKPIFDKVTPLLRAMTYGSDEYKASLKELGPALQHHYANNRHHPEWEVEVTETWKPISEIVGYEVSSLGRVRSLDRTVPRNGDSGDLSRKGQILTPHLTAKGYLRVQLRNDANPINKLVHSLVAEAFVEKPESVELQVNHKDGNKQNNRASNLEWVTASENIQHSYDLGIRDKQLKYIVTCVLPSGEEVITRGVTKMAEALIARGYSDVTESGILIAANKGTLHRGLSFDTSPIEQPTEYSGIEAMSLLDLIEMLCDWKAAGERHADGSMQRSLDVNKTRFKISDQLHAVLVNTARELKML